MRIQVWRAGALAIILLAISACNSEEEAAGSFNQTSNGQNGSNGTDGNNGSNGADGANCFDNVGDRDGNGVTNADDCLGEDGVDGAQGPQGPQGPAGPAGMLSSVASPERILIQDTDIQIEDIWFNETGKNIFVMGNVQIVEVSEDCFGAVNVQVKYPDKPWVTIQHLFKVQSINNIRYPVHFLLGKTAGGNARFRVIPAANNQCPLDHLWLNQWHYSALN